MHSGKCHTPGQPSIRPYLPSAVPLSCKGCRLFGSAVCELGCRDAVELLRLARYTIGKCVALCIRLIVQREHWLSLTKFVLLGSVTCLKLAGMLRDIGVLSA